MLEVAALDVFYGDAQALDGVSISIEQGVIVAIVGANGAGKTSLIRTIAGMQRPMASICCSPPESVPAACALRSASRGNIE